MKCPQCKKEIGFPSLMSMNLDGCPYCTTKITYGLNGLRLAQMSIPATIVCWIIYPYFPHTIIVVFLAIVLLPSLQIDKTYK